MRAFHLVHKGLKLVLLLGIVPAISPVHGEETSADLTELSLESLMDVEITSVAKKPQKVSDAAASVYVIKAEDIHRSGATNIPEALRLAPGLEIAFIDSNKAAMAIRGFNSGSSSNKLLVLIDGRTVYTTLVSGVFWEHQDIMLADIDRIEVIRGPAGTLWGANAVNGVINIITKNAAETTGGLVEGGGGTDPHTGFAALRYGGKLGENAHYRVYGKYLDRGEFNFQDGTGANDGRQARQLGGRLDWKITGKDHITLQGDVHEANFRQNAFEAPFNFFAPVEFNESGNIRGGNAIFRWTHQLEGDDETALQIYYDRFERDDSLIPHTTDTWDVDFQHQKTLSDRLQMLWGLGYRHIDYQFENTPGIQLTPDGQGLDQYSAFLQGDYDLTDKIRITLGSKFEHNDFTGFEFQPSLRLRWQPHEYHTIWAAVSRAVRTPAVFDTDSRTNLFIIPGAPGLLFSLFGSRDLDVEELVAYELGYRELLRPNLSLDISLFYNDYDNLLTSEPDPAPVFEPPNLVFSSTLDNRMTGETYGIDAVAEWKPLDYWRLVAGYSFLKMALHRDKTSGDVFTEATLEGSSPQQQFQLRSYLDLPHNIQFDTSLFWVDELAGQFPAVDDYLRLDFHLGWKPVKDVSLDLFLQNVLEDQHQEFGFGSEVPRSIFARIRLNW